MSISNGQWFLFQLKPFCREGDDMILGLEGTLPSVNII